MNIRFDCLPVEPLRITSAFGPRNTGIPGASTYHKGVDLGRDRSRPETPVRSVAAGVVRASGWNDYRGWMVLVDHDGFQTRYQHLKSAGPAAGSRVRAGQQLGIMGNSSNPAKLKVAVHLHFEVLVGGKEIDGAPYLKQVKEAGDLTEEQVRKIVGEMLAGGGQETPSDWAKEAWSAAAERKLVDGKNPKGYCTREQTAAMLMRLLEEFTVENR